MYGFFGYSDGVPIDEFRVANHLTKAIQSPAR